MSAHSMRSHTFAMPSRTTTRRRRGLCFMSQNSLLVVCGAILMGGLGGYASTLNQATPTQARHPASPLSRKTVRADTVDGHTCGSPARTRRHRSGRPSSGQSGPARECRNRHAREVGPQAPNGPGKKPPKKVAANPKQAADAEEQKVAAAVKDFLAASRSGSADAIARTMSSSNRKGLMARTRWASGAGMLDYQEFAKNY